MSNDSLCLCRLVVSCQVGEIEEQLAAARREVTKSEEANQKLQRDVKEVCWADLFLPGQGPQLSGQHCLLEHNMHLLEKHRQKTFRFILFSGFEKLNKKGVT